MRRRRDHAPARLDRVRTAIIAAETDTATALRNVFRSAPSTVPAGISLWLNFSAPGRSPALILRRSREKTRNGVHHLLAWARQEGLLRGDVGADDLRRLLCGLAAAAQSGLEPVAGPSRYVDILLQGLLPD